MKRKSKGYLHIGSGLPRGDIVKAELGRGQHTIVDPMLGELPSSKRRFSNVELSTENASEFLDSAIRKRDRWHTIRFDMPYEGLIGKEARFGLLCQKMRQVLTKNGKILMLVDFKPDREEILSRRGGNFSSANLVEELQKAGFEVSFFQTNDSRIISRSTTASVESTILRRLAMKDSFWKMMNERIKRYLVIATKRGD